MNAYLNLRMEERHQLCREAEARIGLSASSIEKDGWICWTLRELFGLEGLGEHLTFKGGTSLSKGWGLIERFSEDLDVTVDRAFLGFGGDNDPAAAPSASQRRRRLEGLREGCERWIRERLEPAFRELLGSRLRTIGDWRLTPELDSPTGPMLLFEYPSSGGGSDPTTRYVAPVVRIELGAFSDVEPFDLPAIRPYLSEVFPDLLPDSDFAVRTLRPERTFLEKVMLLHEEHFRAGGAPPRARLSRHYYDLWCLERRGVANAAIRDRALFDRVAGHRAVFFRRNREARDSLRRGSLRLLPESKHLREWSRDYERMKESMIFGATPTFDEILEVVGRLETTLNSPVEPAGSS